MALVTGWWLLVAAIIAPATAQTATQISTGNFCSNRGGSGALNRYSIQISPINLQNCANAVAANGACGNFFSYGDQGGSPDGYCDCVPCDVTSCTASAHGSYATYSIETSYQACTQLASTSVTLNSADLNPGTTPTSIVFSATTVQALSATHTVTITASANIWTAATSVTCTVKKGGSLDTATFASGLAATSATTFVATVASAQSVGAGVSMEFTCTDNLAALGSSGTVVTFTFESYQDVTQVTAVTGWTVAATSMTSCSVAFTPSQPESGDPVTQVEFYATTTQALAQGDKITIVASANRWTAIASVTCTVKKGGVADTATFGSGFAATSTTTFEATVATGQSVGAGVALEFACTSNLAPFGLEGSVVTFTFSSTTDTAPVTSVAGWTVVAAGNDPVARFGNVVREFELPPNVLTTLVESDDLSIAGSVFEGGGSYEQWFDRIVLSRTDDGVNRFLDIKLKHNLHELNISKVATPDFMTLEVKAGVGDLSEPIQTFKVLKNFPFEQFPWFLGQEVAIRSMKRFNSLRIASIGKFPRECVDVAGLSMHIYICSTPASEYYGHQSYLAMKYAHLDIAFPQIRHFESLKGLLPELWGIQPMSNSTKALVKEMPMEDSSQADLGESCGKMVGTEDLQKVCHDQSEAVRAD